MATRDGRKGRENEGQGERKIRCTNNCWRTGNNREGCETTSAPVGPIPLGRIDDRSDGRTKGRF